MLYGVGINDAWYKTHLTRTIDGKNVHIWRCPFYTAWARIIERGYSDKHDNRNPSYVSVSVDPTWHKFSAFRIWMENQNWKGMELDKDILFPGNKVYAPDKCIFVSRQLNSFILDSKASRGKLKIGATYDSSTGRIKASCRNPFTGKTENLGRFDNDVDAHEAWRSRKHQFACMYADQQSDHRIADALRKRYLKEFYRDQ